MEQYMDIWNLVHSSVHSVCLFSSPPAVDYSPLWDVAKVFPPDPQMGPPYELGSAQGFFLLKGSLSLSLSP